MSEQSHTPGFGDGHASDCSVHNAPALPVGPCDCGSIFLGPDEFQHAKSLLRYDSDYEDCERFASSYGQSLLEVHQHAIRQDAICSRLLSALMLARATMKGAAAGAEESRFPDLARVFDQAIAESNAAIAKATGGAQ